MLNGILDRATVARLSGLEQLQLIAQGAQGQPSMASTLDFALVEVAADRVVFRGVPSDRVLNPMGTVHGGWAAAILDSALGCAVHVTLAPGEQFATLELKVNLTRAIFPDIGTLTAVGTIVTRGRRVALSEARLSDASGRIYAHGTSTCLITALEPSPPPQ